MYNKKQKKLAGCCSSSSSVLYADQYTSKECFSVGWDCRPSTPTRSLKISCGDQSSGRRSNKGIEVYIRWQCVGCKNCDRIVAVSNTTLTNYSHFTLQIYLLTLKSVWIRFTLQRVKMNYISMQLASASCSPSVVTLRIALSTWKVTISILSLKVDYPD